MLNIIDEFSRECLSIRFAPKLNSTDNASAPINRLILSVFFKLPELRMFGWLIPRLAD